MVKYVLEDMLRVRVFRKDIAEKNFTQAQRLVVEAEENMARVKDELEKFKVFIIEETDRLYKKVMMQKVKKEAVDSLNAAIKLLKNHLMDHEKRVETEEENLKKAKKNLVEKQKILLDANKNIEKINSHKESWLKEALKEEELIADRELEEFTGKKNSKYE